MRFRMRNALSFLRSALFSTPLIVLATVAMGTISLAVSLVDRSGNASHRVARVWARVLLAVSFIRVRVEGLEGIDPKAAYVFAANHASFMDIPAILAAVSNQFRFFAKKGLFSIPFLGTHLRHAGHFPVERTSARASLRSMGDAARLIRERGASMLLFPEGGRSEAGLQEFKEGAAYIAIKAGVPAVPVGLDGMREKLPMGSFHIRAGRVTLRIGKPISTKGMTVADRMELNERLYREVARLSGAKV
jgi:1-acyl-sn-glycerol-3-phosphate acyltransferase